MGLLDALVVASVAATMWLSLREQWRPRGRRSGQRLAAGTRRVSAGAALSLVVAAVYLNQLLVVVYVRRVHHGNAAFVARWLPDGWFELPRWGWLDSMAAAWPAPDALAASVLHVPALLELPFVLLAYLVVAERVGGARVQRLLEPAWLWPAAVVWTVAFALIEWHYRSPWTTGDLMLRFVSCVVTPVALTRWVRSGSGDGSRSGAAPGAGTLSAARLLVGVFGAACIGGLVLVVYETALLYNLARLPRLAWLAALIGLALAALWAARRRLESVGSDGQGAGVAWLGRVGVAGFSTFLVPALPVRYDLTFGTPAVAALAALVVVGVAAWSSRPTAMAVLHVLPGALVGASLGAAAVVALRSSLPGYYEARLLVWLGVALVVTITGTALADSAAARRRRHDA